MLVWIVLPETREVDVYAPGQPVRVLSIVNTLAGGDVLPVADIFPESQH